MQFSKQLIVVAVASALAACGGGSEEAGQQVVATPVSGKMVDGYVSGATVFCDSNGNGTQDTGEASTTTGTGGEFTLTAGCTAKLIGSGGTDTATGYAFTGQLQAPAGSTVITPLTTLLAASSLTAPQLAQLLSLPAGTDVRTIDIGNGQNADLLKKTLAVQQVMANLTKVLAAQTGSTDAKALYTSVAAGLGAQLAAAAASSTASTDAPLISASGSVNETLLASVVKSIPAVAALTVSAADLDAAINSIAAEAQVFAKATTDDLVNLAKSLQDPVKPSVSASAAANYLALRTDAFLLNGQAQTLTAFQEGLTATDLSTIGFNLNVAGTPAAETIGAVALELVEQGGRGRKLQLLLDEVKVQVSSQGVVSVSVPTGAKVYAFGHAANGTDVNLTLSDLSFKPITVVENGFNLNYTNMVEKVLASVDNTSKVTAEQFLAIQGTFSVKVVMSKVNFRHADGSAFANQTIKVTNTAQSVTGAGFSGLLTVR